MSLILTESFMGIDPTAVATVDDSYTSAPGNYRVAYAGQLRQAGFDVVISDQLAQERTGGFMVRPDPVIASRNALVFGSGNTSGNVSAAYVFQAAIRKVIGGYDKPIICGFSLFIPPEFAPIAGSTDTCMRVLAGNSADTSWSTNGSPNVVDVFNVTRALQCRWYTDAYQSTKALVSGKQNYLEFRIADGEIKVWLDDVLVVQKSWSLTPEYIAIQFVHAGGSIPAASWLGGAPGRWAISNMYMLTEDDVAPNTRLGPSTRVIGQRPTRDIAVQFLKPDGAASNASIAAQGIGGVRTGTLQTAHIGDSDIYAADQTSQNDTITASKIIHAISSKVSVQNIDGLPHTIRPTVFSPQLDEGQAARARTLQYFGLVGPDRQDGWSNTIMSMAIRPTDKKIFAVGCSFCVLTNTNNGQGDWTKINFPAWNDNQVCWSIAFRSDGTGVFVRNDGQIGVILPGTDNPIYLKPGGQPTNCQLIQVKVHPDGYFVISGGTGTASGTDYFATSSTPDVLSSWTSYTGGGHDVSLVLNKTTKRWLTTNLVAGTMYYTDDIRTGAGWKPTAIPTPATVMKAVTHNGQYFFAVGDSTIASSNMLYSTDCVAWTSATTIGSQGTGQATMSFVESDPDGSGFMIMGGASGSLYTCAGNPALWRPYTRITGYNRNGTTTFVPVFRCACKMPNGDWLIVGDGGIAAIIASTVPDRPLPNGAGYTTIANPVSKNPTTGAAWTPSEASLADFGMRINS